VGARYAFSESLALHTGFFLDQSPVDSSDDEIFTKMDLFGIGAGVSFTGDVNSTTIGLSTTFGENDDIPVSSLTSDSNDRGTLELFTVGLVIATSFSF